MAALIGHSSSAVGTAGEALDAGRAAKNSATVGIDDIDFETEAESRGMHLMSCTRVSKRRGCSLSCFVRGIVSLQPVTRTLLYYDTTLCTVLLLLSTTTVLLSTTVLQYHTVYKYYSL